MAPGVIGLGVIGTGWITRAHVHALHTLNHIDPLPKRVDLTALSGRSPERVRALARELGFKRWRTSWQETVEDADVDVVATLTSNELHAPVSIAALEAGKPVLCEKPLADTLEASRRMRDVASATRGTQACGFNYRYMPAVRLLRDLVASGDLGTIRHFRGIYLQEGTSVRGVRDPTRRHAGALGDYSHLVDQLRFLVGEPANVSAMLASFVTDTEDAYVAALGLRNGGLASLEASRCATGWKARQRIEVNGSDGSAWWDMEHLNRLHVYFARDAHKTTRGFRDVLVSDPSHPYMEAWWPTGHLIGWEHTLTHQWRAFLEAVIEGRPVDVLQATFEDGYRADVINAAFEQAARDGRCLQIPPPDGG